MSETLRDLVVSLSLNSDNFTRNIRSITKQIQDAQSAFALASAGVEGFEKTSTGLATRLDTLNRTLKLQQDAVTQYERALEHANNKLRECYDRQNDYAGRLEDARSRQASLKDTVAQAAAEYKEYKRTLGETDSVTVASKASLTALGTQYRDVTAEVRKLSGQKVALTKATQNAADAVSTARTKFHQAQAAVKQTGAEIERCSAELRLAQTNWASAGQTIQQSEHAVVSIGKQLKLAESSFKLAGAGIKDFDKSTAGLASRLELLTNTLQLQERAVGEYETQLRAAREQLAAAQSVNDPEKIHQATDAVTDAESALNNARAAVRQTRAEIEDCNQQLSVASSAWTAAGKSAEEFGRKYEAIGRNLSKAGRLLTTTMTTPIAALGASAIKASIDYESAFTSVRKTVDATEAEYTQLSNAIKEMSTVVASPATEIAEVTAVAGQLGIANDYLIDFTRTMIDLGNSTDIVASEAASTLAKFANITGMSQAEFTNLGSALVDLGNNYATTESTIMKLAMRLAAAGHQVGLTEAQILGFATALSSVGIEAEMGGSAFSKALVKMEVAAATGGEALEDFARVSGMTAQEFKHLWDTDPATAFQSFIVGLSRMDDAGESAIATLQDIGIAEVRLRDTLLRSVNATELFSRAQVDANRAWKENSALSTEAGKRYATTESRLKNLKNTAVLFSQQIGNDLNPTIQKLIGGANDLMERFMEMDEAQRKQVIRLAAIAAAAGPVLLVMGKLTQGVGAVATGFGKFAIAVGKAGGGFSGFMTVLAKSPAVWLAVAAGVTAGTVALVDFLSGAKAAREALKGMEETAKSWKETAAETFYNQSGGLSFFGMSQRDFARDAQTAQSWVDGLIAVWTDGKKESDELVAEWTGSFKALTESTRKELAELKATADAGGYTGVSRQLQKDMDALDAMDREIERLLKRRQNGFLTEREKIRLQELIDTRDAIEVRYKLSPAETDSFDTIVQKVEAEIARAQARGQADAAVAIYENALVACAEGMAAVNAQIDAQYDKEYAIIQLMEDEAERKEAQAALDERYRANRLEGAREYAAAMAAVVLPVWEQENIQQAATDVAALTQKLREYSALDMEGKKGMLAELNELTAAMDESSLVEYIGLLTQIQSLLDNGMSEAEIQAAFPDIDFSGALNQLASIQQYLNENKWDVNLTGISEMFGEALPDEVIKLSTDLDMTGAQARWDEFAANPGAITTEAIIAGIQNEEDAQRQQILVDAVIEKYTEKPEGADRSALSSEGLVAYVQAYAEATNGADVSALNPQNITAIVAAYQELAAGADISTLKPNEIIAYVRRYLEAQGVDMTGLTPEALTATVMAYEEMSGGALTTALTPENITAVVARYLEAEGVDVSKLRPDQIVGIVTSFAEATGCDKSQLLTSFTAYVTEYRNAEGVSLPIIEARVGLSGYDTIAYQKFVAEHPVEVAGVVRLGEIYGNPAEALGDESVKFYDRSGMEVPVTAVPQEKLTAQSIAVLGEDGTLHVLITPKISGTEEAVNAMRVAVDEVDQYGVTMAGRAIGLLPTTLMNHVESAIKRIENYKNPGFLDMAWLSDLIDPNGRLKTLDFSMQSDFNAAKVAELSTYVGEVVSAIQQGKAVKEEDISNLQSVLTLISELDTLGVGENVTQGIAQGMTEAGWDSDAETVVSNLETAINTALDAHSPAQRMVPIGENVSGGIGQGAKEYDFSADAEALAGAVEGALQGALGDGEDGKTQTIGTTVASDVAAGFTGYDFASDAASLAENARSAIALALPASIFAATGTEAAGGLALALSGYSFASAGQSVAINARNAVSSKLTSSTLRQIGVNAMSGLAAGIRAGQSGVESAMKSAAQAAVSAAKKTLKIKSPSQVFRDEVGVMSMRGMGVGVVTEAKRQAAVIRNASRYLTDEAKAGAIAHNTTSNSHIYNNSSSVNLSGNNFYIRDEQDIRSLAVEIAALTRRQQRGRGIRMA